MQRSVTHLDLLNPVSLKARLGTKVYLSCSLAICVLRGDGLTVCGMTVYKERRPKITTVPAGSWEETDANILATASREFVEEMFGRRDKQRQETVYGRLYGAWDKNSPSYNRLSVDITTSTSRSYKDLHVHVSLRYLLNMRDADDLSFMEDVIHYATGTHSSISGYYTDYEMERTSDAGWYPLSTLKGLAPSYYNFNFDRESLSTAVEWRPEMFYKTGGVLAKLLKC